GGAHRLRARQPLGGRHPGGRAMSTGAATPTAPEAAPPSRKLAYAQLLRLPNVFTAFADIALAALATGSLSGQAGAFGLLALASGCLYCAGMVWNDYFDYEQDLRERPFRPLPSQRIPRRVAAKLGAGLLAGGVFLALLAGIRGDGYTFGPVLISVFLT